MPGLSGRSAESRCDSILLHVYIYSNSSVYMAERSTDVSFMQQFKLLPIKSAVNVLYIIESEQNLFLQSYSCLLGAD